MASRLPASCILWPAGSRPWCPASQVRDNWPNPTLNMMMRCYIPQILQAASLSTRCAASPCWPPWATPSSWWWPLCSGETPLVNSDYMHTTRDDDVHSSSQLLYCSQCCAALHFWVHICHLTPAQYIWDSDMSVEFDKEWGKHDFMDFITGFCCTTARKILLTSLGEKCPVIISIITCQMVITIVIMTTCWQCWHR